MKESYFVKEKLKIQVTFKRKFNKNGILRLFLKTAWS